MRRADAPAPIVVGGGARAGDERLRRALRAELDREVDALDAPTLGRLRAARRTAVAGRGRRGARAGHASGRRALGGPMATAALVVAMWALHPADAPDEPDGPDAMDAPVVASTPANPEGLPLPSAGEDPELYRSIDFLLWLDGRPERG